MIYLLQVTEWENGIFKTEGCYHVLVAVLPGHDAQEKSEFIFRRVTGYIRKNYKNATVI